MKTAVFIVEGDPSLSMYVMLKLDAMFNFITHLFPSAEEALENMHLAPDIFVMDYQLPGMNGFQALKEIKALNPEAEVIILSAQSDPGITADIIEAGAYNYIRKNQDAGPRIVDSIVAISRTKK
jgi:DNA-binding NarL/FixJ family response regulator